MSMRKRNLTDVDLYKINVLNLFSFKLFLDTPYDCAIFFTIMWMCIFKATHYLNQPISFGTSY